MARIPQHDRWVTPAHPRFSMWHQRCWKRIFGRKFHALLHGHHPDFMGGEPCMIPKDYVLDGIEVIEIRANDPKEPL